MGTLGVGRGSGAILWVSAEPKVPIPMFWGTLMATCRGQEKPLSPSSCLSRVEDATWAEGAGQSMAHGANGHGRELQLCPAKGCLHCTALRKEGVGTTEPQTQKGEGQGGTQPG